MFGTRKMVVNTLELGKGSNTSLQMETEQFPSKLMTSSLIEEYRVRSLDSISCFSAGRLIWLPAALCTTDELLCSGTLLTNQFTKAHFWLPARIFIVC